MNKVKLYQPLIIILLSLATSYSIGQRVDLQLRAGTRIKTNMIEVTTIQMFTADGVFSFTQLKSASFWDVSPDSISIMRLRKGGITVYLKRQMLSAIKDRDTVKVFSAIASLGFGLGLDYGGGGAKVELFPAAPVGIFGGVGSNFSGVGFNAGMNWKFHPYKKSTPYVIAMYGYNAVYQGQSYNGFTTGFGGKFNMDKQSKSHFSIAVLIPFRDSFLKEKIKSGVWAYPVLLSFGFNFNLGMK